MFSWGSTSNNGNNASKTDTVANTPETVVSTTRNTSCVVTGTKEGLLSLAVGVVKGGGTMFLVTPVNMIGSSARGYGESGARGAVSNFFSSLGTGVLSSLGMIGESTLAMGKQMAVGTLRTPLTIHAYMKGQQVWNPDHEQWEPQPGVPSQ